MITHSVYYKHVLFVCFFGMAFSVLLAWVKSIDGHLDNETFLLYGGLMFIITFPFGVVANLTVALLFYLFGLFGDLTIDNAMIQWAMYFIAGYIQWFVILPALISRYRQQPHKEG